MPWVRSKRPDCPRWLSRFVQRLMEKNPEDRFADAEAAQKALETHRRLLSHRTVCQFVLRGAAFLLVVAASAAGLVAWRGSSAPGLAAVRTTYDGDNIRGLGANGAVLWTLRTSAPIQQVEQADLFGDGKLESIVVSYDAGESRALSRSASAHISPQVLIVSPEGKTLNELRPEDSLLDFGLSIAPPLLVPAVKPMDLLGDGTRQILLSAHHRSLGTANLWLYWPAKNRWSEILDHWGGWLYAVEVVPGARPPRLNLLGFNGVLAAQPFEASLLVRPQGSAMIDMGTVTPAPLGASVPTGTSQFDWYTLLPQTFYNVRDPVSDLVVEPDGSTRFLVNGKNVVVDRWGNPVPGPNAGHNLSTRRMALLGQMGDLYYRAIGLRAGQVKEWIASMGEDFSDLLQEEPERAAFQQVAARALARAGAPAAGASLLEEAIKEDGPNDSLLLNLSHLLAIEGELKGARRVLREGYFGERTPAGGWLSLKVLGRIAIELHDRAQLQSVELQLGNLNYGIPAGEVLGARARLWWNEPVQGDTSLGSFDLAPEGEAIACLARWRLHKIQPGDIEAMTDSLRRNPDAAGECLIARAIAKLSLGHPNKAVTDCLEAERRLSERAPCEFWAYQTMQLAKACHAKALLAAGRRQKAVELARGLLLTFRPGLLPYILASEVANGKDDN